MKRKLFFIVCFAVFFLKSNAQCAMCRAVLESEAGKTTAEGINDGIVYLMVIPYLLIGGIGYYIYKRYSTLKK